MMVKTSVGALKEGRWYEHVLRFVLGGAATVITGLIARYAGPEIGGLFLALPAMLCASATLVDSHETRRKREAGLEGSDRGKDAAALDAAGAAAGSVALLAFAAVVFALSSRAAWTALCMAAIAWCATAVSCWWVYKRVRASRWRRRPHG
jgi:hypothetical protein